jgi:ABC-type transporter Mla maintaining outer membrane lipid asymmetry ATPase subunit MlaF
LIDLRIQKFMKYSLAERKKHVSRVLYLRLKKILSMRKKVKNMKKQKTKYVVQEFTSQEIVENVYPDLREYKELKEKFLNDIKDNKYDLKVLKKLCAYEKLGAFTMEV